MRLTRILLNDPSSNISAAVTRTPTPAPRLEQMLADLIDVTGGAAAGRKWKPYARPWDRRKAMGDPSRFSQRKIRDLLAMRGPRHN